MVVPALTLTPSLNAANLQPLDTRVDCARTGMLEVLNNFITGSNVWGANRRADGLGAIDAAVAAIRANWIAQGGAGGPVDQHVTALLNACTAWLQGRQVRGRRVTGWRESSIRTLYWQAGFAWSCDHYVQQALRQIDWNNLNLQETCVDDPVPLAAVEGHFYSNPAEYTVANAAPGRLLRGDTRGPITIRDSNGFQPRNIGNRWDYKPWWTGHATGDTISTTTTQALAIQAGPAARAVRNASPEGHLPPWLDAALGNGPQNRDVRRRGYVYEIANIADNAVRMANTAAGHEDVYLAIPLARLTNWWVVDISLYTFGPIPFEPIFPHIPIAAPQGAHWSNALRTLA